MPQRKQPQAISQHELHVVFTTRLAAEALNDILRKQVAAGAQVEPGRYSFDPDSIRVIDDQKKRAIEHRKAPRSRRTTA